MRGAAVSGVLLRASWRIAFTLLLWVFIIFIILLVFKCLKSLATIIKNQGLVLLGHGGTGEALNHPSRSSRVQPYSVRREGQGSTSRSGRRGPTLMSPVTTPTLVPRPPLADQPALEYFPPHTPVPPPGPSPLPPPYSLDLPPAYETLFPSNLGDKEDLPPV